LENILSKIDLTGINTCFSEEEPGLDGFSGLFYKMTWGIIKLDVINAFNALLSLDARSFHLLNNAMMILVCKKQDPATIKDYRSISLMHSFSKLFTKCLPKRLAPHLKAIVSINKAPSSKSTRYMTISGLCSLPVVGFMSGSMQQRS
jgi:hypothetical protein